MKKTLSVAFVSAMLLLGACSNTKTPTTIAAPANETTSPTETTPLNDAKGSTDASSDPTAATVETDAPATDSTKAGDNPNDTANDTAVPASTAKEVVPPKAVTDVSIQPGLADDKFVGAASDVTTEVCQLDGTSWKISGKVTNKSGAKAAYRIYVALNRKGTTDTRGLMQVNVDVDNGKSEKWSTQAALSDPDLTCILRVERTAK